MKKLLLFALALGIGTWSYGQANVHQAYKQNTKAPESQTRIDFMSMDQPGPVNYHKSTKGAISFITLGYSGNVYTMLVEQQSCLTTNQDIGLLSFTHRGGGNGTGTTADILNSHSVDGGDNWTTNQFVTGSTVYANRYPSGVIYNPTNNTIADSASIVYCGPSHNNGDWDLTYFGSAKFDSSNVSNQYIPSHGALVRMGMTSTTDGKIHVVGPAYTAGPPQTFDTLYSMTGTYNATTSSFDWSTFKIDSVNFVVDTDGADAAYAWHWNNAWSDDGTIGYIWTVGRLTGYDFRSYQPVVWKTTNSGMAWSMMTPFDFTTITDITDRLQDMQGLTTSRPQFSSSLDGVVDANGDLHLISYIQAAFSNNDDSLGYSYSVAGMLPVVFSNPIFDVYTTTTGWDARYIASTYTVDVAADESGFGSGTDAIGWDLRLQAGRTKDGTKIFIGWADSDTASAPTNLAGLQMNAFPNLYVAAWDIVTTKGTNPTNFTMGSAQDGDCYFHYLSDIIIDNNGVYTIPMTEIDKGNDPANPVTHNFVKGIELMEADFVLNPGFSSTINDIASVSQNRPNPFNGNTSIDVNLNQASDVVIEILNITGQKVMVLNNGRLGAGTHTFQIEGSQLSAGVYFYTVHAGSSSVTKKMIVQ